MARHTRSIVREWVEASRLDPLDSRFEMPAPWIEAVAESRIVLLGEPNHFMHEKVDYRLWWIDHLSRYFPIRLGEELGRSDAYRADRFLATGDDAWLERIPTFGYKGDDRTDRDDGPTGILKASFDHYPTALFKAEQCRFYRGVRALGRELRLTGIDIDGSLGSPCEDIRTRLLEADAVEAAAQLLKLLERVHGETLEHEQARLTEALQVARRITATPCMGEVARDLIALLGTFDFVRDAYPAPDYASLSPALAAREQLLKQQVAWALDDLAPGEKMVLMAHAFHLARDDEGIGHVGGAGPGGATQSSLGHHLVQECGGRAFSVWMLYGSGADSQPFPDLPNRVDYPTSALNRMLLEDCATETLLPTASLDGVVDTLPVGHMYNSVIEVRLPVEADVIHFVPAISPLRNQYD